MAKPAISAEEKVAFIKKTWPDYMDIDPTTDLARINELRRLFRDNDMLPKYHSEVADSVFVNLILRAQGKPRKQVHTVNKKTR